MNKECKICKFYKSADDIWNGDVGFCRRNPPSMPLGRKDLDVNYDESDFGYQLSCRFPMVQNDEWCGEFKNK